MEVENAVSGVILEYPRNVRLGSDLVTENAMFYGKHQCRARQTTGGHTCSVDGGIPILEDTPPGRKEMLQHGVKVITQYH